MVRKLRINPSVVTGASGAGQLCAAGLLEKSLTERACLCCAAGGARGKQPLRTAFPASAGKQRAFFPWL